MGVRTLQTVERHDLAGHALRSPRGRYGAERASQLSGVPRSTIYDWQREGVLVPDYPDADPMQWSYRDLVLLRLLARMRERGVPRPKASAAVATVRDLLSDPGSEVRHIRLGPALLLDDEPEDSITGEQVLGFMVRMTEPFDLLEPIDGVNDSPTRGPDLLNPSAHTYIAPDVMGGDVCIGSSRVPSATVHALRTVRSLPTASVVSLHPQLTEEQVEDATELEMRMRATAA